MILCEVSFEVCNKVGGIYTVVQSKASILNKNIKRHITIGPWLRNQKEEFLQASTEAVPPEIQKAFDALSKKNIFCTYGRWNVHGFPETILIDYFKFAEEKNKYKQEYWEHFRIDSLETGWDFEEPLCFSTAAGMLIEELSKDQKIIAQFHEWLTGFGLLYLKQVKNKTRSVFTTHATTLGRSLSERGISIYDLPADFNPDKTAKDIGVIAKHTTEKAVANNADCFTTVSKITAKETELLLGKKPDILTPNGLDIKDFPKNQELEAAYINSRIMLLEFSKNIFNEDMSDATILYTSGRPEFQNKGFDILLESLADLNKKNKKIICFFFIPWKHYQIKDSIQKNINGDVLKNTDICTHYIEYEQEHPIIKKCNELGLDNKGSVKVIWYPSYIGSREDIIFKKTYYQTISGCDLGIFASSYEPWGYTPLESIACGVPAITTDLCGFGQYMNKYKPTIIKGLEILSIKKENNAKKKLTEAINTYLKIKDRKKISKEAYLLSKTCDWNSFIKCYLKAYGIK